MAGRAHRSCSQGGCTHSGQWVVLHPPASPAPHSAGCSVSPSTQWSPARCRMCCQLGRTKAWLRVGTPNVTPTAFHTRRRERKRGLTHKQLACPCFLLQNKDLVVFLGHVINERVSFYTIGYRAIWGLTAPPRGGPGSPPILLDAWKVGGEVLVMSHHRSQGGTSHSSHRQVGRSATSTMAETGTSHGTDLYLKVSPHSAI